MRKYADIPRLPRNASESSITLYSAQYRYHLVGSLLTMIHTGDDMTPSVYRAVTYSLAHSSHGMASDGMMRFVVWMDKENERQTIRMIYARYAQAYPMHAAINYARYVDNTRIADLALLYSVSERTIARWIDAASCSFLAYIDSHHSDPDYAHTAQETVQYTSVLPDNVT